MLANKISHLRLGIDCFTLLQSEFLTGFGNIPYFIKYFLFWISENIELRVKTYS